MQRKEHKRKNNHVVIVTSDAVDASVKQFRIKPWVLETIIVILCIIIGALIGYFVYEAKIWETVSSNYQLLLEDFQELEANNQSLITENDTLKGQIQILSETVNQKVQTENELTEVIEKQSLPTEFPLTGSASLEEITEGDYMCVFTASVGTTVVATASGSVLAINDDEEYGHAVWIDHGNGYVTIYRNKGDVNVRVGENVVQGTTLFLIGENNSKLGYQMMLEETYIDPMSMLEISG